MHINHDGHNTQEFLYQQRNHRPIEAVASAHET